MQRLPRAALLVLGEGDVVVGVVVALRAHEALARHRAALQVLRQQPIGPADGGVGVIVRPHCADAGIHLDLVAHRAVDHHHRRRRARGRAARRDLRGRNRQDDREILRLRARHHGVHRHLLDRVLPGRAKLGHLHLADDLVGFAAGMRQHGRDALLRRQDDGKPVGPVVLEELALQIVFGIRLDQARRGALERGHASSMLVSPATTSCITGRPVMGSLP